MSAVLGVIIAALLGAVIAAGGAFALVSSQTSTDSTPIDQPLVVYGTQS